MAGFKLTLRHAELGNSHPDIEKVQQYLRRFGYLRSSVQEGMLDADTSRAIQGFQSIMHLAPTGKLDPATAHALERHRCGLPDGHLLDDNASSASYVLRGCSYPKVTFSHRFANGTPDIFGDAERTAIQNAFQTWANALCGVNFVAATGATDFVSGWFAGDHGDGAPFDGPGNVIAHAFYPPPCGGSLAGHMHFDEAENWSLTGAGATFDLETVALHEIGHLLGLAHSADPNAIMYPTYTGVQRSLSPDDVAGVRRLYPYLCRRTDSGSQAGGIFEVDTAESSDGQRVVNAVRTLAGTLKLIAWNSDLLARVGDSGTQAGEATLIQIARNRNSDTFVTACSTSIGTLKLISWDLSATGNVVRRGDSGLIQLDVVSIVRLVAVANDFFVTSVRIGTQLHLTGWRLNADGSLSRLVSSGLADVVNEIAVVRISDSRVATAIRDGNGSLKVILWQVSPTSITRLSDSGTQAGEATHVRAVVDAFGNVVTAVIAGSGQLKIIVWRVSEGAVVRLGDSGTLSDEGATTHDVSFALGHVVSALRTGSGVLKVIMWTTTSDGAVSRVGDSAFLAGAITQVSLSGNLGASFVTSAQIPDLKLISWQL